MFNNTAEFKNFTSMKLLKDERTMLRYQAKQ